MTDRSHERKPKTHEMFAHLSRAPRHTWGEPMSSPEFKRPVMQLIRNSAIRREALRVAPGRPNLAAGLRAGLATTVPLVLASVLAQPELTFASLGGFSAVLADKGGAYRTRARSMSAVALFGGIAAFLGMWGAVHPVLSVAL